MPEGAHSEKYCTSRKSVLSRSLLAFVALCIWCKRRWRSTASLASGVVCRNWRNWCTWICASTCWNQAAACSTDSGEGENSSSTGQVETSITNSRTRAEYMGCRAESVAPWSSNEDGNEGWVVAVMISQSNWEHLLRNGPQPPSAPHDIEPRPRRLRHEASRRGFRRGRDRRIPEDG